MPLKLSNQQSEPALDISFYLPQMEVITVGSLAFEGNSSDPSVDVQFLQMFKIGFSKLVPTDRRRGSVDAYIERVGSRGSTKGVPTITWCAGTVISLTLVSDVSKDLHELLFWAFSKNAHTDDTRQTGQTDPPSETGSTL